MQAIPSKNIGGREYLFYNIPARRLHKLKLRIVKHLAKAIGKGFESGDSVSEASDLMKNVDLGKVLTTLADNVTVDELDSIYTEILCQTKVKASFDGNIKEVNVSDNFDVVFMGDYFVDIEKVVFEALKVYFGNFLNGSFGNVTGLLSKATATR